VTTVDGLVDRATSRAQLTDLGGDSWREGLDLLVRELDASSVVTPAGRAFIESQYVDALWNRLRVIDYAKQHPEVREERIARPLVILGMPRTGTTVASYLLDQDPHRRSLLHWEAPDSVPPPTTVTLRTDPRCLAKLEAQRQLLEAVLASGQGYSHWEDADGPTECMFVQNQEFKALVWDTFQPTSVYSDWLMSCDMTSVYEYQKLVLQILQSQAPGTWSLKMPSHAVYIETLLSVFPDARIVWAHRDPYKATASLCDLQHGPKKMILGDAVDPLEIGRNSTRQMREHVTRPLRTRARVGDDQFFDLYYHEMIRDPIGQMRRLYEWAGDELDRETEARMQQWLRENPQDRFGPRPYSLDEYGLTVETLTPVFAEYLSTFDIEMEGAS